MQMRMEDRMKYPWLAMFMVGELPTVVTKTRVWRAFRKYAFVDGSRWGTTAAGSVRWGTGPMLSIEDLDDYYLTRDETSPVSGMFKHSRPHEIFLDDTIVADYERDHSMATAKRYVEATILHELVHWANYWTGNHTLFTTNGAGGLSVETHTPEGFEIEAYGRVLGHW